MPEPAFEELTVDGLARRAARRWPDRTALRLGHRTVTYAELDTQIDRAAAGLRGLAGGDGASIAVATTLDPDFAALYYATARSGNVIVSLNPMMREQALRHVLAVSRSTVAVVTADMYDRVRQLRDDLPQLRTIVVFDPTGITLAEGDTTIGSLLVAPESGATGSGPHLTGPAPDLDATACLHFTSGTGGAPRAVRLTHRNLTVNAAQTARAQGLDAASVTLNQLPLFHLMHLNSAVWAGATQVLFPGADTAAALTAADEAGATHYFSLPVRLAHLAADPRLPGFTLRTARGIFSGGSALPARAARVLQDHFGIPVVQGYGLAEASPIVTIDAPGSSAIGSSGFAVAGTELRIVDLDTALPVPPGAKGEIQVRGPQLMKGYLGEPDDSHLDGDGWFATGDIGRLDEDGRLYVTDRRSDVFKRDNELVAPADVEEALAAHPAVRECVVFGHPDPYSGHVPHGLIVLHEGQDPHGRELLRSIHDFTDARLAEYQRLGHLTVVDAVPRSRNGKVQRRELRERFAGSA